MYEYEAEVLEVYDGDTITARLDLGCDVFTIQKLRLYGINTPEMRGEEKVFGKEVRDYVREKILGKKVIITTLKDKKGKFGRYLAIVTYFREDEHEKGLEHPVYLNDELLEKGYAKEFMKDD